MSREKYLMQGQQDPERRSISPLERMANSQDTTPTESAPAEWQCMQSVTIDPPAQMLPVQRKRLMTRFEITYSTNHDNKVYKVCLPSMYKGWAITAENKDAASPGVEEVASEITVSHNHFRDCFDYVANF